jgi:hypothetical protein
MVFLRMIKDKDKTAFCLVLLMQVIISYAQLKSILECFYFSLFRWDRPYVTFRDRKDCLAQGQMIKKRKNIKYLEKINTFDTLYFIHCINFLLLIMKD